ncbi:MAG: M10 family metallopeptidase C-terminal domain-containing protein [Planctomycetaceae bacterium]|nr:M10 family metallopeptidase C-terminal domain-containing protein [Planctomycetaceae bacterium]
MSTPSVLPGDAKLLIGSEVLATSLFSVNTGGLPISRYRFRDLTGVLGGSFIVNGNQVMHGDWFEVTAAEINTVFFRAALGRFTETIQVQIQTGTNWSNVGNVGVYTGTANSTTPTLAAQRGIVVENETLNLFSLLTYFDADNDPVVRYRVMDNRTDALGGYFTLNGVAQSQGQWFEFTSRDAVRYVAAPGQYEEGFRARAYDGTNWSAVANNSIFTRRNSNRPFVALGDRIVRAGDMTPIRDLFVAGDEDGNTLKTYSFRDTHDQGGHLLFQGQMVTPKTWLTITAAQLDQLYFVGASGAWTENMFVQVNDGKWNSTISTIGIRTIVPPVLNTGFALIEELRTISISPLVQRVDNGLPITTYRIIHQPATGSTGEIRLGNQLLQSNVQYTITPTQLTTLRYRGGVWDRPSQDYLLIQADNGTFASEWKRVDLRTMPEHLNALTFSGGSPNALSWKQFIAGEPLQLTYSFFNLYEAGYAGPEVTVDNFIAFNQAQRQAVRSVLAELMTYINVEFTEVSASSTSPFGNFGGELRFGNWFNPDTPLITFVTNLPDDPVANPLGGDIWLNMAFHGNTWTQGTSNYATLIRHINQAMGIKYRGQGPAITPGNIANPWYTSMPGVGLGDARTFTRDFGFLDVYGLQTLYGQNRPHNAGDTVYQFTGSLPGGAPYMDTIWDTGGINTLDFTASNNRQIVDLRQGAHSHIVNNVGILDVLSGVPTGSDTYTIAYGVQMHHVLTGNGNDTIRGNELANTITANGGNDSIRGMGGNDILRGGAGDDQYIWALADGHDRIEELGGGGRDRLVIETNLTGISDFTNDLRFTKVGNMDLRIEFMPNGGDPIGSVLIQNQQGLSRVESLVLQGLTGGDLTIDITTFMADLPLQRTALSLTNQSSVLGRLVAPIV